MNALTRSSAMIALCVTAMAMAIAQSADAQTATVYVDIVNGDPDPPNHGQNGWGLNAYRFLQDAIDAADWLIVNEIAEDVEIWVAAGTYRPDQSDATVQDQECTQEPCFLGDGDRDASFDLRNHVSLFGGFPAHPHTWNNGQGATFADRDPVAHETFLSGDLLWDDEFIFQGVGILTGIEHFALLFGNYDDNSYNVVMAFDVDRSAVLDGFIVQSGAAGGPCDEPTGDGLNVPDNLCRGQGLYAKNASPTIRNVVFRRNQGVSGAGVTLDDVPYNSNEPDKWVATFENCTFIHNQSGTASAGGTYGGGLRATGVDGRIILINSTFEQNKVTRLYGGGGAYLQVSSGSVDIVNCRFIDNLAMKYGFVPLGGPGHDDAHPGAIHARLGATAQLRIWNSLFIENKSIPGCIPLCDLNGAHPCSDTHDCCECAGRNTPGAIFVDGDGSTEIINCTIAENEGQWEWGATPANAAGGVVAYGEGEMVIANSILWGNGDHQLYNHEGTLVVTHTNIEGGWTGTGNIDSNPLFMLDYRLGYGSPSKEAGATDLLPCDEHDIAPHVSTPFVLDCEDFDFRSHPIDLGGEVRILGCAVDMGVFEHEPERCPDIDRDGAVDVSDLLALLGAWGQCADACDCPEDLNADGAVDVSDLLILLSSWGSNADCENMIFDGDEIPQTVQDCLQRYEIGSQELEDCLYWVENQQNYME